MFTAYIIVTVLTAAANFFSPTLDFIRYKQVLINMAKAGLPESWITMLGTLKAAGALGLLVGIGVPLIGTAAAVGGYPVLCWCHHHPPARTRLLVRSGGRVSPAGRGRAGIASGLVVSWGTHGK